MTASDARWFRTQRTGDAVAHTACTDASALSAIAAFTRGAKGPDTSLDEFRALQLDKEGGIDLYDVKFAARRMGIPLTVYANYGPGKEYTPSMQESLRDFRAATFVQAWEMLSEGRYGVMQIDYRHLPKAYHRDPYFNDTHAVGILAARRNGGMPQLLVGDPLDKAARWCAANPYWAAAAAMSSPGTVNIAVTPVREPLYDASVRIGFVWVYTRAGSTWTRRRRLTGGFSAPCTPPFPLAVMGHKRPMVRLTSGFLAGHWLDDDSSGVNVKEVL